MLQPCLVNFGFTVVDSSKTIGTCIQHSKFYVLDAHFHRCRNISLVEENPYFSGVSSLLYKRVEHKERN